jgi:hypothetical protein
MKSTAKKQVVFNSFEQISLKKSITPENLKFLKESTMFTTNFGVPVERMQATTRVQKKSPLRALHCYWVMYGNEELHCSHA